MTRWCWWPLSSYRRLITISTGDTRSTQSCPKITSWLWLWQRRVVFTQRRWQNRCPRTQFVEDRSYSTSSQTFSTSVYSLVTSIHQINSSTWEFRLSSCKKTLFHFITNSKNGQLLVTHGSSMFISPTRYHSAECIASKHALYIPVSYTHLTLPTNREV